MSNEPAIPTVKHFNPDLVDLYDKTWVWISKAWHPVQKNDKKGISYLSSEDESFDYFTSVIPTFFLIYSGEKYDPCAILDFYYSKQEENGAIRSHFDKTTYEHIAQNKNNPEDISVPLFASAEYAIYNKTGNKKRLKDVVPKIKKYYTWLMNVCGFKTHGLLKTPSSVSLLGNVDRKNARFLVEFNCAVAIELLRLTELGDILNEKPLMMFAKPLSDAILCGVRDKMWSATDEFLYDLDANGEQIKNPHIGEVFYLLSNEVNHVTLGIIKKLKDPNEFNTYNVFPTVPKSSEQFESGRNGFKGGVSSILTFFAIKGLENKGEFIFASECAMRHLFTMLESLSTPLNGETIGDVWEVYKNESDGPVMFLDSRKKETIFPKRRYLPAVGLITINLLIENVIGMNISLPQKTVHWTMQSYSEMGIENFPLKRNSISIQCVKNDRGWEIRLESEKLYYFTLTNLSEKKEHKLPIPSGKCSLLPEKV